MITVPQPRVLDGNLQEVRRLRPLAASITLTAQGTGEATLTLAAADPRPAMHQWVELFTQHGSAGLYRVTGISNSYTGETQITLRHGIDTLSDSVYPVQAEEATLTVQQLLVNILSYQTARVAGGMPWQLGTCEDTTSVKRAFNYDNLASLLQGLEEEKQNFYFTYDFTTTPWTLNFMRKPQDVRCEFRLTRNIEGVTVTLDDSELCTQLLLSVNVMTTTTPTSTVDPDVDWPTITANDSAVRTYDNAAAQAEWGIVQKTASIDTQDDIIGQEFPNADAWAARFMADHSQPTLQIQITGEDLSELTGDTFDELALAALCRVALPDHDALFSERVVTVTYPDVYGAPTSVTVSLANRLPKFSSSIAQAQKEAARAESTAKTARRSAGGGGGGTAKELESWAMIVKKTKESADVTGLTELSETGIILDAETGAKIYSLTQGFVSQYAELNVQSGQISSLVQTTDGLSSQITQQADQIALKVSKGDVATQLSVELGNVTISNGNLVVEGYVSAAAFEAEQAKLNNLMTGQAQASTISTQTLRAGNAYAANLFLNNEEFAKHNIYMGGTTVSGFYLGDANLNLAHYHAITATENNGVITITQGAAQDTAGSASFDIADTQFYKDAVASATAAGKAAMGVLIDQANQSVVAAESATKSALIASMVSLIYNTSNHKYTATTAATANGTTMHTNSAVSGSEAYDAGESDGYTSGYSDGVNDGYATGAASVTVDSVLKYQADDYDSTTHNYTVYVRGTASNGKTLDNSLTVSGASAYNAGNSDGYQTGYNYGYSRGESDGAATEAARYINCGSRYWGYSNNGGATWNWYYSGTMYTRRSS